MSKSTTVCVYCGSKNNLTKDHIPPKSLFAKPLPGDLITVPSCRRCNRGASKDDEYFRLVLVPRRDVGDHPEAIQVWDKVIRSFQYPEAKKFTRSFLSGVSSFFFENEQGFIEPGGSYTVDHRRLGRVASRIVKGLFWKETGERLPDSCEVSAYVDAGMSRIDENVVRILDELVQQEPVSVGRDVFKYWWKSTPECKYSGAWLLLFYGRVTFFCLALNPRPLR